MKKFFTYDGPITKFGNQVASLLLLNLLTLICCIPIVTIGASFTAMHYVTFRIVTDEDPKIAKSFFKAFKVNFINATKIWLIYLLAFLLIAIDFQIFSLNITGTNIILKILVVAVALIVVWVCIWTFILLSRYDDSIKHTIKNAALLIPLHPVKSVIILAALFAPIALCLLSDSFVVFAIALGVTIPAYIQAKVYQTIFLEIEGKEES